MERSPPGRLTPVATSSMSSGATPARRMASATTRPPSLGNVKSFRAPPNFPNGLRTALMTTTSSWFTIVLLVVTIFADALNDGLRFELTDLLFSVTQHFLEDFGVVFT